MTHLPKKGGSCTADNIIIEPMLIEAIGMDGFGLIRQLRPHLRSMSQFKEALWRLDRQGYRLIGAVNDRASLVGLAGYRRVENFVHGRFFYVDDLVVDEAWRGRGIGRRLLSALCVNGKAKKYDNLVLDTGADNRAAQTFYNSFGLVASAVHYIGSLSEQ